MIGETREDLDQNSSKAKIALRDALVTFLYVLIAGLLTAGYPPTLEVLYTSGLSAALMGITSYMHARGIEKPPEKPS